MTKLQVFNYFFLPRIFLAAIFSYFGYYGYGGDAEIYHAFGLFLARYIFAGQEISVEDVLTELFVIDVQERLEDYQRLLEGVQELGVGALLTISDTTGIIVLHAIVYYFVESPFLYLVLVSILCSCAYYVFFKSYDVTYKEGLFFAVNPASIFFCATHFKEPITEAVILLAAAAIKHANPVKRNIYLALCLIFLMVFRFEFSLVAIVFFIIYWFYRNTSMTYVLVILGIFAMLSFFPWGLRDMTGGGPIYSLIYANELTVRIIMPIFGLLQPLPFVTPVNTAEGIMFTLYSVYHGYLLLIAAIFLLISRHKNSWIVPCLAIALLIGFYTIAISALKARTFVPFLPLLALGVLQEQRYVWRFLARSSRYGELS